jgi:SHS2 domain-containing protein
VTLVPTMTHRVGVSHRILAHTADTGVEASAADFPNLVVELATGMFESMATVVSGISEERAVIEIEVTGSTPEDIVIGALSELLYESEVGDLHLCDFRARAVGGNGVNVTAHGVPLSTVEVTGPPIKAVTYHDLRVEETDGTWYGRVYFDV